MVLGFTTAQVAPIMAGTRRHCLREGHRYQVGMRVEFYAYLRRVGMYPFRAPAPVVSLRLVELSADGTLLFDGQPLPEADVQTLAQFEGFACTTDLLAFLASRPRPFRGQLICWGG